MGHFTPTRSAADRYREHVGRAAVVLRPEDTDQGTAAGSAKGTRWARECLATGWLLAVAGWLGCALWYLSVLGGARPSAHLAGVLCSLILTQVGRVLLTSANAAAKARSCRTATDADDSVVRAA